MPQPTGPVEQVDYNSFARDVHSQCGEDGIIEAILDRLPEKDRWAVEFGAWDGVTLSNTAALEEAGYTRILIEADRRSYETLRRKFAPHPVTRPIHAVVGWEPPNTLDDLLAATPIPVDFDVLSIDIDGNDYHVWAAVTSCRPKIVVIEFNPTIRNGIDYVQDPDVGIRRGCSISSLVRLGRTKDYELAAATEYNAIFVRSDLFGHLGLVDNSVDRLRTDTSWQSEIFFGFDGHALISGGRGLEWHGTELRRDIRLVPRLLDGFPGDFGIGRRGMLKLWQRYRRMRTNRDHTR